MLLVASGSAFAGKAVGDAHPEEAYPDNLPALASAGPYASFIQDVQEKLHQYGFDAGPVNGQFGTRRKPRSRSFSSR